MHRKSVSTNGRSILYEKQIAAPLASLIATLVSVGRLFTISQNTWFEGVGNIDGGTIMQYLFGEYGTLQPNVSLHLIFATLVLWLIAFSIAWFVLTMISDDRKPSVPSAVE
jgi:hypothetical protein